MIKRRFVHSFVRSFQDTAWKIESSDHFQSIFIHYILISNLLYFPYILDDHPIESFSLSLLSITQILFEFYFMRNICCCLYMHGIVFYYFWIKLSNEKFVALYFILFPYSVSLSFEQMFRIFCVTGAYDDDSGKNMHKQNKLWNSYEPTEFYFCCSLLAHFIDLSFKQINFTLRIT